MEISYLKEIFDSTSPASFGRHACFMVLLWVMLSGWWVMYDDWANHKDLFIPDVPAQWVIIIIALFGIAAGKEVAQKIGTKNSV